MGYYQDRITETKKWQTLFPDEIVEAAKKPEVQNRVKRYSNWYWECSGTYEGVEKTAKGRTKMVQYRMTVRDFPTRLSEEWKFDSMQCTCAARKMGHPCIHLAALLTRRDKTEGPQVVMETEYEYRIRTEREAREAAIRSRTELLEKYGTDPVPVTDFFKRRKTPEIHGLMRWDMRAALEGYVTNRYEIARVREMKQKDRPNCTCSEETTRDGREVLKGRAELRDPANSYFSRSGPSLTLDGKTLKIYGSHRDSEQEPIYEGCEEYVSSADLVLIGAVWDEADARMLAESSDYTDQSAEQFFAALNKKGSAKKAAAENKPKEREKVIMLSPRILIEDGEAKLSFRIGRIGGRLMVLRNLQEMEACEENRKPLAISKKETVDFAKEDFADSSRKLYEFIKMRIGEIEDANEKIENRNYYSVRKLSVTSTFDLKGSLLDTFYDAAEGGMCEYNDKTNAVKSSEIRVGYHPLRFTLEADRVEDARGTFAGVSVHGLIPVLIDGSAHRYILNASYLSRVTDEELARLAPFNAVADGSGYFRFRVGRDRLQEFYYRVVPALVASKGIDFIDRAEDVARDFLPPEPVFTFYLDYGEVDPKDPALQALIKQAEASLAGGGKTGRGSSGKRGGQASGSRKSAAFSDGLRSQVSSAEIFEQDQVSSENTGRKKKVLPDAKYFLTLRGTVAYDDKVHRFGARRRVGDYRDTEQEARVLETVHELFPFEYAVDEKASCKEYAALMSDADMYEFLRTGLAELEEFGTVKGSEAFRKVRIVTVPQVKLGVSVDSGIMDLKVTSEGLSQEELLAVFNSYRRKRRWHRLKSGDYIDLTDSRQIAELEDLLHGLDLNMEDVIKNCAEIPMYRALYLDRLLQKHEEVTSSRDRVYRALIRNFKTVQDAEVEPPVSLEDVLRPYQLYGYKWLMTLTAAGFGGILADEMGLGKTLEMISVILADRQNRESALQDIQLLSADRKNSESNSQNLQDLSSDQQSLGAKALHGSPEDDVRNRSGNQEAIPSLIVCPASLVYNWQEEFRRFAPELHTEVLAGTAKARNEALGKWDETDAYIISYELLRRNIEKIERRSFRFIVLDEAQHIKNAGAAVTKSVKVLHGQYRFALTGTPVENRLAELWSIFDFLMPGLLYSHAEFEKKYETPIAKNKDEAAIEKLRAMTGPFILRRKKEDVLKDLPAKLEETRYVRLAGEQQKLYDAEVLRLKGVIDTDEKIKIFAELTKIREICCDPSLIFEEYKGESAKRKACLDLIESAIDGGHRMLVFSQFTSMLALLEQDLKNAGIEYYLLTGSTSKEKRIRLVHAFNDGNVPVFLISLKAGGTGLNLTGADVVIHYDPWWNLAAQNQATDRTHRIGQTKQVTVYKLILKNTIEERIQDLQESKRDLADSILEGRADSLAALTKEELLGLLE